MTSGPSVERVLNASPETVVLAHGVGTRADLPFPTWLALYGSGAVVLISFLALAPLWHTARLDDPNAGVPFPGVARF